MKRRKLRFAPLWTSSVILLTVILILCVFKASSHHETTESGSTFNSIVSRPSRLFVALTGRFPSRYDNAKDFEESMQLTSSLSYDPTAYDAGPLTFEHSNYTADVVIPHFGSEDLSWTSLLPTALQPTIYTNSSSHIPLPTHATTTRITTTKGHEALTYLTHITTHYDRLPDITLFVHPHATAWHNNDLLSLSTPLTLARLNPALVLARGYFNLRCHWDPGCPTWLHPAHPDPALQPGSDALRQEEPLVAQAWPALFPGERVPERLAQACCGQFAVSREQIRAQPRERYERVQAWLEGTELSDYLSGRVLEYVWQYLFAETEVSCPDMRRCYCAAYGVCFGSEERFQGWFEMKWRRGQHIRELEKWAVSESEVDQFHRQGKVDDVRLMDRPKPGRIDWLEGEIRGLEEKMERVKREAWERGRDPRNRDYD
ncbi:MAG: hypothetical protein M1822_000525 [Bathelium mastoideum]|nr:MAG: hypothetical protein M1822_000525 [Bathelium mastoideum]